MRVDTNNPLAVAERLMLIAENFGEAARNGISNVYTGPRVKRAEEVRLQDFLPLGMVPGQIEMLVGVLKKAADTDSDVADNVVPTLRCAADALSDIPERQLLPTLMEYAAR